MKVFIFLSFLIISNLMCSQNDFKLYKDHDALQVKDLEKSASFYRDVLGLKEIDNAGLGENFVWFQLSDKVQVHLIKNDEEITKYKGVHIALNTDDLNAFMEFLISRNVPFENWIGEKHTTNTRPDGIKQIYLQDPDGYWIEVNDNSLN